jgi:hypothetical protein
MGLALADNDQVLFRTGISTLIKGVIGIVSQLLLLAIFMEWPLTNEILARQHLIYLI